MRRDMVTDIDSVEYSQNEFIEYKCLTDVNVKIYSTSRIHSQGLEPPILLDQIRSLLRNRIHAAHDIPADVIWEDTRIRNSQAIDALHSQSCIQSVAESDRSAGMILPGDKFVHPFLTLLEVLQVDGRWRDGSPIEMVGQVLRLTYFLCPAHGGSKDGSVSRMTEVGWIDDWVCCGICIP